MVDVVDVEAIPPRVLVTDLRTVEDAERFIAGLEKSEPEKVHRGGYSIDASEEEDAAYQRRRVETAVDEKLKRLMPEGWNLDAYDAMVRLKNHVETWYGASVDDSGGGDGIAHFSFVKEDKRYDVQISSKPANSEE